MKSTARLLLIAGLLATCAPKQQQEAEQEPAPTVHPFVAPIEASHGKTAFVSKDVLLADLTLSYADGTVRQQATMAMSTDSKHIRYDYSDGFTSWYQDGEAFYQADSMSQPGARFDLLTWTYFTLAPFKFSDPGTQWKDLGSYPLDSTTSLPAAYLTFEGAVGDTPDDLYYVYRDAEDQLEAVAYIVTFGRTVEEAEEEPHVLVFSDETTVEGVTLATRWDLYVWYRDQGIASDLLLQGKLEKLRFTTLDQVDFNVPAEAKPLPYESN